MNQRYYFSIASGSSGNCGLYVWQDTAILIDLGVSVRRLNAALAQLGLTIAELDAVLLTHEHTDHIKGLATFFKKFDIPVYASHGTADWLLAKYPNAQRSLQRFYSGAAFSVGQVAVQSFPTPHDAAESVGYVLRAGGRSFGFATDLGFLPGAVKRQLLGCDTVVLESNHDVLMLETGPYPWSLKQRVAGPRGHLSNADCAQAAVELIQNGTGTLILAHLSEHNNTPLSALRETRVALDAAGVNCELFVAPKAEMAAPIDLAAGEGQLCSPSA